MNLRRFVARPSIRRLQRFFNAPRLARARCDAPRIERLESRIAPANIVATVAGHILQVVANDSANSVVIDGDAADATVFHVSSSTDTVNGIANFTTPAGVTSVSVKMLNGDDILVLGKAFAVRLKGGVSVNGGTGANEFDATNVSVGKSFAIINGTNLNASDGTQLKGLLVGGSLTIKNGDGDTDTTINSSRILGNVSVTNGTGQDANFLFDTDVKQNVIFKNGHGDGGGVAGFTNVFNIVNTLRRSVIGGSLSIAYLDGGTALYDGVWDTEVIGNVTFDHGSGGFRTVFDGFATALPALIHGSLTIKGAGANTVSIGLTDRGTGLRVGQNLTIATGDFSDALGFKKLEVGGGTKLLLSAGNNAISIDDSTFVGAFLATMGSGADQVNMEIAAGSSLPTIFESAVVLKLGTGANSFNRTGLADANQALIFFGRLDSTGDGGTLFHPAHEFYLKLV